MKMEESLLFWGMNDWQTNLFVLQWSDLGEESRALMPFTKVSGFHEKDTAIHSHATPIIQIFFLLKREYYSNLTAPFHPAFLYFCIQSVRNKENVACFNVFMAKKGERFIHSLTNHSQGRSINKQIEYRGGVKGQFLWAFWETWPLPQPLAWRILVKKTRVKTSHFRDVTFTSPT